MYGTVSYMTRNANLSAHAVAGSRLIATLSCPASAVAGRSAEREAAIFQAVVQLLNETSYESVTMDAVASRAKASKATIYRRWSNKDQLVVEALKGMVVGRDLVLADTGNLRDDIIAGIDAQRQDPMLAAVNTAALKVLVYAASTHPALAQEIHSAIRDTQIAAWQRVLQRAYSRGELHDEVDADLIFEVMQGQFCARTGVDAESVDNGYVEHVVDDVLMPVIRHAGSGATRPHDVGHQPTD